MQNSVRVCVRVRALCRVGARVCVCVHVHVYVRVHVRVCVDGGGAALGWAGLGWAVCVRGGEGGGGRQKLQKCMQACTFD